MKTRTLLILLSFLIALQVSAQISDTQYKKIDSLFLKWNQANHPGGTVGIMQKGKTVFSKAYGFASLEYPVPNSLGTIFNTGSVSKQFTAMGLVVLQQEGKLSIDDDIRKYLPELPDFGETITIRHLLHHTSGLRSLHAMLELAGWRSDDARTNEDLNRFMKNQQDLNFKPGDEYAYCNTGYMLMVNIIEKVTGAKFPQWMTETVFEPLGMKNTYVEDNYRRIVANNATSYYEGESGEFERAVEYWGYVGSGNMHSTSDDLLRWLANFKEPQTGWETHFDMLQTVDTLNNGRENIYAFGLVIGDFNGLRSIGHSGGIGGFRSIVTTYPEEELSIVVLTNFSKASPGQKSNAISEILLVDGKEKESIASAPVKTINLSKKALVKYERSYWNATGNYERKIYLKNDTLRYFRSENSESPIVPIGNNEFQMLGVDVNLKIQFDLGENESLMRVTVDDDLPIISQGFDPTEPSKEELVLYTGKFYSPELETTYIISLDEDSLFCHHARHGDSKMKRIKKDILKGDWPLLISKFQRDEDGNINGILVSNGRVRNLWFEKQE
ncbi:serine hydrolase domain-containing protein [Ancylomarina sp. YFZ004]